LLLLLLLLLPRPQALESSLAEAFDVNRSAATISITSMLPSGGDVGDVWAAMELTGSADKHLQAVASEWGVESGSRPWSATHSQSESSPPQPLSWHMSSQQVC
jgi:hypothetical protein